MIKKFKHKMRLFKQNSMIKQKINLKINKIMKKSIQQKNKNFEYFIN